MRRTTITIDDEVLRPAKREARRRGMTVSQLVEEVLRRELSRTASRTSGPAIPVFRGDREPRRRVDLNSNRALLEALDENQALDRMR